MENIINKDMQVHLLNVKNTCTQGRNERHSSMWRTLVLFLFECKDWAREKNDEHVYEKGEPYQVL